MSFDFLFLCFWLTFGTFLEVVGAIWAVLGCVCPPFGALLDPSLA